MNVDVSASKKDVARHRDAIAHLLLDFSPNQHAAWPSLDAALAEVDGSLQSDKRRISAVAVADGDAIGWVAGFEGYSHGFELHPIVVRHDCQRRGVGRALLEAFEATARRLGAPNQRVVRRLAPRAARLLVGRENDGHAPSRATLERDL